MKKFVSLLMLSLMLSLVACSHGPATEGDQALADLSAPTQSDGNEAEIAKSEAFAANPSVDQGADQVAAAPTDPAVSAHPVGSASEIEVAPARPAHHHKKHHAKKVAHGKKKHHGKKLAKRKHKHAPISE